MTEQSQTAPTNTTQAVYLVMTAAIFLVAGLLIAMLLTDDGGGLTQDDVRDTVNEAVGTQMASSLNQADVQAIVDASLSTQVAGNVPVMAPSGNSSSDLTQGELQALIDQAVGTQVAALQPTNTPIPPTPTPIPVADSADDDAFQGPADAPVVIVEFSDFQCGYCNRWAQQTLPRILEAYPDEVKFVYRDFTIFGEDSIRAAMAAECAEEYDQFWAMHNVLFNGLAGEERMSLAEDNLVSVAGDLGIDEDEFRTCLSSERYLNEVIDDSRTAQQWGFGGTPGFIINGVVYPFGAQSFEVFDSIIRTELEAAGAS